MPALQLTPHPATPCPQVRAIAADLRWHGADLLLHYRIDARPAALRVPAPAPPAPAEGLWQHLCLEAFFGADESTNASAGSYREFNFSPSGCWAAFAFSAPRVRDVRDAACPALAIQPRLQLQLTEDALRLSATLPQTALPPLGLARAWHPAWQVGLAAVIETADGALSYWALAHPAPRPDFHQRAGWTLRLAPPATPSPAITMSTP